ncbi:2Fe-2S iron-sulfur cluster-binding protein [Pseudoduganella lutea]|uniref:2Fe-2S iron-sulfur cluster binding domain-containing protein n=1 Tax=Pseudoduganella lutea TaxID=321985 RepID=A0A4P6KX85_9BURK|nr:2Fe-2S iron-sulfur cluster binding domain-containing protein [Pseudoduganella lutea]QBE63586.1 2Fe-2S iron-sulfur cluster binding domain-containing protein [Pseudoduganella lutea]
MAVYRIRILPKEFEFDAEEGETLLHAAERAGIRLPSSCRNGTCRTCLCGSDGGRVRYLVEWPGLSFDERQAHDVLPCVAMAETDITLIAPAARKLP